MITGAVLILSALFLLFYNRNEDREAGNASDEILTQMKEIILEEETEKEKRNEENQQESETDSRTAPKKVKKTEVAGMPAMKLDGEEYIGYLTIPELNLELPVMAEWSYAKLQKAPCREVGSIKQNDMVIAAHNYMRHFGKIGKLVPGDVVMFTDMNGVTSAYQVAMTETLQPKQVKEMRSGEWDLTMYTCTYSGRTRVAVRCQKVR